MRIEATSTPIGRRESGGDLATTDDFMTLLVAQLEAQDPLEPMDASQFLAQLSQLQTVSELNRMNSLLAGISAQLPAQTALALMSRTITWADTESGELKTGVVERIELSEEGVTVVADGTQVALDEIITIH